MRSMVKGYVRKAFSLIGDLAEDVQFVNSGNAGFNFSTGGVVPIAATTHTFRAVVLKEVLKDTNLSVTKLLLMTEQLDKASITSIDVFDRVIVRGITLSVIRPKEGGSQPSDNGYTITLYAALEDV
jgi:hypothetical protein